MSLKSRSPVTFCDHRVRMVAAAAVFFGAILPAVALDYSVPFVRDGLSYTAPDWANGVGAVVGQIEVRNGDGNGIDGFDGSRHAALGTGSTFVQVGSTITNFNYGYQDVHDFSGDNSAADSQFHGTFVAGIMANSLGISLSTGNSTSVPFSGVAPGAQYYGAIFSGADTKVGFLSLKQSLDYLITSGSTLSVSGALVSGTQVINNSWGSTATSQSELDGNSATSLLMDEYVGYKGKTGGSTAQYMDKLMVIAAGNSGGLLGQPADSFNGIVVGALDVVNENATGLTDPNRMPVARVAPYSAYKPLANGRSGVDLVAPGTNIWSDIAINVAQELWGITSNSTVAGVASGTSFAAPHVTGEAALLYGAHVSTLPDGVTDKGTTLSTDHKLIKALLINSADKIPGLDADGNAQETWQPGLVVTNSDGVLTALAPLNYAVGAGMANANSAFQDYREAGNSFWDLNTVTSGTSERTYAFGTGKFVSNLPDQPLLVGLTATLVWDRHVDLSVNTSLLDNEIGVPDQPISLSDLDLVLRMETTPGTWLDLFISSGSLGNVDLIYMASLPTYGTGNFELVVRGATLADAALGEEYALAVEYKTSTLAVPEPATSVLMLFTICLVGVIRFRRRIEFA